MARKKLKQMPEQPKEIIGDEKDLNQVSNQIENTVFQLRRDSDVSHESLIKTQSLDEAPKSSKQSQWKKFLKQEILRPISFLPKQILLSQNRFNIINKGFIVIGHTLATFETNEETARKVIKKWAAASIELSQILNGENLEATEKCIKVKILQDQTAAMSIIDSEPEKAKLLQDEAQRLQDLLDEPIVLKYSRDLKHIKDIFNDPLE